MNLVFRNTGPQRAVLNYTWNDGPANFVTLEAGGGTAPVAIPWTVGSSAAAASVLAILSSLAPFGVAPAPGVPSVYTLPASAGVQAWPAITYTVDTSS